MITRLILRLHDFLIQRRWLAWLLLVIGLGACIVLGWRLDYKEDVADFLPSRGNERYSSVYEKLGDGGRITVIFRPSDSLLSEVSDSLIMEAVDAYGRYWLSLDGTEGAIWQGMADDVGVLDAMDFLRDNIALFLTLEDYQRIDSLLEQPHYIDTALSNVHRMLSFPMSNMATEAVRADPLNLFSPVLQRLQSLAVTDYYEVRDGYLFDTEGRAYAFITSPYASSDTRGNSRLAAQLQQTADTVMSQVRGVGVSAVGAPLIAATNASRIKTDSMWAGIVAMVLILIILFCVMGHRRNVICLGLSVVAGWLFALGVVALFRPAISIIVIGIGSVLIGIAVNYPLHFLDHLRDYPNRRLALKDMVEPLLTGNITTVSAFACLLFVKAEAMRDLGLFGALMLVGTIFFVLVFLPLVAVSGRRIHENSSVTHIEERGGHRLWPLWVKRSAWVLVLVLTLFLALRSGNTTFDDDLHNINYMTAQQREDLALLSRAIADNDSTDIIYWVSEDSTLDEALQLCEKVRNERGGELLNKSGGISLLIPSTHRQQQALEAWESFCLRHKGLMAEVRQTAMKQGFAPLAFAPFEAALTRNYQVMPPEEMNVLCDLADDYLHITDSSVQVVGVIRVACGDAEQVKQIFRHQWNGVEGLFAFNLHDVGSNLVSALSSDFNYILFVCGFVVFAFLWLSLGRLELALLSFLPLAVGWLWILGLMDLTGVRFNIVNIILATFIFGQGDDYSIFITEGLMYEYAYGRKRLRGYRKGVVVSALLMFVGMGVLLFAKHPALRSLAEVAVIGMAVVIVMACMLPPMLFRWLTHNGERQRTIPITLKRLLSTLLALLVLVLAATVVVTPLTLLYYLIGGKDRKKRFRYHQMMCWCCRQGARLLPGVRHQVVNSYNEDFRKPAVLVANHQSHLDLLYMLMLTPKLVVLTNDWVWRNPIYRVIIRYAEYLPVTRGYESLLPDLQRLVDEGYSVLVFPEGTRSKDGSVGRFHKGAFLLAQQLRLDVLPIFIHGVQHVLPKEGLLLCEGRATVVLERRISYSSFADTDLRLLTRQMRHYFVDYYTELRLKLENETYWLPVVRYQYMYKGREVALRCHRALRRWQKEGDSRTADADAVERDGKYIDLQVPNYSQQGEVALLTALAHPDRVYRCRIDQVDDYDVACHCALLPKNLQFYCLSLTDKEGDRL